jgi:hypothetical protein
MFARQHVPVKSESEFHQKIWRDAGSSFSAEDNGLKQKNRFKRLLHAIHEGMALTRDLSSEKLAVRNPWLQFHTCTVCRRVSVGSIKYEFKSTSARMFDGSCLFAGAFSFCRGNR